MSMSNVTRMPNVSQQSWSGSWPPSCSCGCNPCQCGGGFGGLMQCWQDIAQFQQFLKCMLSQMGPYPMQGVTDGSDAAAGVIGEFMTGTSSMAYAASVLTTGNVSPLVLSPGDWDIWASMSTTGPFGGAAFNLNPAPAGMSNILRAWVGSYGATTFADGTVVGPYARGSFTVPTLLPFSIQVDNTPGAEPAGTATLVVSARRRR
jgi:hypothetical protein